MSALANHAFAKMNGIGNEIVVVDLRDSEAPGRAVVSAAEARAVASPAGAPYDQLMVLQPPRLDGTEAYITIYNNDGSEAGACGNGMRCVVRRIRCAIIDSPNACRCRVRLWPRHRSSGSMKSKNKLARRSANSADGYSRRRARPNRDSRRRLALRCRPTDSGTKATPRPPP